jgi:hypothetical protein
MSSPETKLGYQEVLQLLGDSFDEFQVNQGGNTVDNPLAEEINDSSEINCNQFTRSVSPCTRLGSNPAPLPLHEVPSHTRLRDSASQDPLH